MNALTLLKQDHQNVDSLFQRFTQGASEEEKADIRDKVVEQLSVHAAIEEQLFYPAVRSAVGDLEATVLESLEAHHVAKWTLSELETLAPTAERFDAKMTVLIDSVRHHAYEEEEELFPKVREAMSVQQLEELGQAMETAKATAPTRPHPRTPDTPPLNVVLGAGAAIVDKAVKTGKDTVDRVLHPGKERA